MFWVNLAKIKFYLKEKICENIQELFLNYVLMRGYLVIHIVKLQHHS